MSKAHRGSGIRKTPNSGRGTCPICKRTGIKLLYEQTVEGTKVNVCKTCDATIKNAAAKAAKSAKAAVAPAPAAE
ncbi:MAG: hypothetical protein WCR02_00765 [Sphaerochaetaceae bacterium]